MKRVVCAIAALFVLAMSLASRTCHAAPAAAENPGSLEIAVDFTRGGRASSQFAIWIEDAEGKLVKTVYATRFTANGGYRKRPESLPTWVAKVLPAATDKTLVDGVSGPTPKNGAQRYAWDGTDHNGKPVPAGEYRFILEGSFFWANRVFYSGIVWYGGKSQESIEISTNYFGGDPQNRDMIRNVRATYTAGK